jgi:hypothetical protein
LIADVREQKEFGFSNLNRQNHLPVYADQYSLFLPVLEFAQKVKNHWSAGTSGTFRNPLAVFLENHPVFGQITGRRVRI